MEQVENMWPTSDIFHGEHSELDTFRVKRKIQVGLRRFILTEASSYKYAHFFGTTKVEFREWMEMQFEEGMEWTNYADVWDIDHRIPVCYFNIHDPEECRIVFNFINIRPSFINGNRNKAQRVDVAYWRNYFSAIHKKTGHPAASKLVARIDLIARNTDLSARQTKHIRQILEREKNKPTIETIITEITRA